jgi:hypothetical protein
MRGQLLGIMLVLILKRLDFVQIFFCLKTAEYCLDPPEPDPEPKPFQSRNRNRNK